MRIRRVLFVSLCTLAGFAASPVAQSAQGGVEVRQAELSVPFGIAQGKVVVVADQFVFVDEGQLDASFAIARADITAFEVNDGVLRIATRTSVTDRTGRRSDLRVRVSDPTVLLRWYRQASGGTVSAAMPAQPDPAGDEAVVFQARHSHRLGSCIGRLVITDSRLAYESVENLDDARRWAYADIREVRQDGIYKLRITPFVGDTYNLDLLGTGLDSAQFRQIIDAIAAARVAR